MYQGIEDKLKEKNIELSDNLEFVKWSIGRKDMTVISEERA